MPITYRAYNFTDVKVVTELMQALYSEDPSGKPMNLEKIHKTVVTLLAKPEKGEVLLIENQSDAIGYALLINYWSNEYGGNILNIDELYVRPEFRGQGIATNLVNHLAEVKLNQAVALQLEVTPGNVRAQNLYQRLGFAPYQNQTFMRDLV